MKQLIFLSLIWFAFFSGTPNYSSTWAGTGMLQGITFQALADAVSTGIVYQSPSATIPNTLELITKADLTTYNIQGYGDLTISGKASNRVLIKSDFYVMKIDVSAGQSACGGTNFTQTLYVNGNITPGTYCYTNKERTTAFVGDGTSWYGYCFLADNSCTSLAVKINSSGMIVDWFAC